MTEEEIKKFINKCLDKRFEDFRLGYMRKSEFIINRAEKRINDNCSNIINNSQNINNRMQGIELSLQGNQQGLQNVYDIFQKLTDGDFITNFESKRHNLLENIAKMQKQVFEITNWIKKVEKKISVINNLYSLRNQNEEMISKLAHIFKAINNIGDE